MSGSVCVLLFGNDAHLLETRRWVLECGGCRVYTATHFMALDHILNDRSVDLVILCHSLNEEECTRARSIIKAHSSNLKILNLTVNDSRSSTKDGEQVVSAGDGPKSMLEAVYRLVNHGVPPRPSAAVPAGAKASA